MYLALQSHTHDNVATVFANGICSGATVAVKESCGRFVSIDSLHDIPYGHKIAIHNVSEGEYIIKYGEIIGVATERIERGSHVHTHNVKSTRGRGDL